MRKIAFWASLLLIFVIPWENVVDVQGVGTVSKATGLLVAVVWGATIVIRGKFRRPHPFHIAMFIFILWNVATFFWSVNLDMTLERLITYAQMVVMVLILWDLYETPTAVKAGMQVYILGAYIGIGSLIHNYAVGIQKSYERYSATGFDNSDFGITLALGIPIAWHLAVIGNNRILNLLNYTYPLAVVLAVLLTASRGALLAIIPGFFYIVWRLPQMKLVAQVLIFTSMVVALFVFHSFVPASSYARLATVGTQIDNADLNGRVAIWLEGLAVFEEHPYFGVGSGAFRGAIETHQWPHNTFLSILVDGGIVGFALFGLLMALIVHQAVRQPKWVARMWLTVLVIWVVGVFPLSWEQRKQTWLAFNLVIMSAGVFAQHNESGLPSDPLSKTLEFSGSGHEC